MKLLQSNLIVQYSVYIAAGAARTNEPARVQLQLTGHCIAIQQLLLLLCAKSHMLSASRRQPHLLHESAVDLRQIWSVDKS